MTSELVALCLDANDPMRLARFWAEFLGWELVDDPNDGPTRTSVLRQCRETQQ